MTVNESTLEAIKSINDWVTAREVYNYMISHNLYIGKSKTPDATIHSTCVRLAQDGILQE